MSKLDGLRRLNAEAVESPRTFGELCANAQLVAAARNALPALLRVVEAAGWMAHVFNDASLDGVYKESRERLVSALAELEAVR